MTVTLDVVDYEVVDPHGQKYAPQHTFYYGSRVYELCSAMTSSEFVWKVENKCFTTRCTPSAEDKY